MPELLRAYGDLLQPKNDGEFVLFAALAGVVLLVTTTFTIGALIETATRAWNRKRCVFDRGRRKDR